MITAIQKRGFGILLYTGMMLVSAPCFAGFEFSASPNSEVTAPPTIPSAQAEPLTPMDSSMPVSAEPLMAPANDPVLSNAVSRSPEPIYIHRQRKEIPMKPAANEAVNTQALLDATNNMQPVSIAPAAVPAADSGKLVINPYPLQTGNASVRGGSMGSLPVEQAMMEQTGMLRPVAVPGQTGQTDRAHISSRYDNNPQAQYLNRAAITPRDPSFSVNQNANSNIITPIPGGEGAPIAEMQRPSMPAPAPIFAARRSPVTPDAPAPMPVLAVPSQAAPMAQNNTGFGEAVGFGRDLPLALALSQVIPAEYSYAFGQNVNVGTTVSWQGGKPWNQVLDEMLAAAGMRAVIQNGQVTIQNANG